MIACFRCPFLLTLVRMDLEKEKENSPLEKDSEYTSMNINEKNINIAVRFLTNQNVRNTSKDQKVNFLKSKGLSEEEITIAMQKAEQVVEVEHDDNETSTWSFWDYLKGVVLGAGILSSANYAYKAYVLPYVAHEMKDDTRIELLNEGVQFLKDDLKQNTYEFTCTLKSIQTLLEQQKTLLENIENRLNNPKLSSSSLDDIKGDLGTLKSMLLKNDQFPPAPFFGGNASGVKTMEIPAWQRAAEQTKTQSSKQDEDEVGDEKEDDETEEIAS